MANLPSGPVALLLSLAPPSSYHMLKITLRAAWPIENATQIEARSCSENIAEFH